MLLSLAPLNTIVVLEHLHSIPPATEPHRRVALACSLGRCARIPTIQPFHLTSLLREELLSLSLYEFTRPRLRLAPPLDSDPGERLLAIVEVLSSLSCSTPCGVVGGEELAKKGEPI